MEIKAPMPGKIMEILVHEGDSVSEEQELIILEAMKMETPIYAESTGTVKAIMVKVGDKVNEDDLLMVLE